MELFLCITTTIFSVLTPLLPVRGSLNIVAREAQRDIGTVTFANPPLPDAHYRIADVSAEAIQAPGVALSRCVQRTCNISADSEPEKSDTSICILRA